MKNKIDITTSITRETKLLNKQGKSRQETFDLMVQKYNHAKKCS